MVVFDITILLGYSENAERRFVCHSGHPAEVGAKRKKPWQPMSATNSLYISRFPTIPSTTDRIWSSGVSRRQL